jgi:hypothetical protein
MRTRISATVVSIAVMAAVLATARPAPAADASRDARSAVHNYAITVYTSNISGAGTDAEVRIYLFGSLGKSGQIVLDKSGYDDAEAGREDNYSVTLPDVGNIRHICLWRDDAGLWDEWHVSNVVAGIPDEQRAAKAVFNQWIPAFRWVCMPARYRS